MGTASLIPGGRPRGRPTHPARGTGSRSDARAQSESAPTTSPPSLDPMAHHAFMLMLSFTKRTEPSQFAMFTPPEWLLVGVMASYQLPGSPPGPFAAWHEI